jgi:hypothetical protein
MATCRPTLFLLTVKEILLVHFIITNFRVAHKMLCTPRLRNPLTTSRLSCLGRKAALTTIFLSVRQSRISQPCYTNNYFARLYSIWLFTTSVSKMVSSVYSLLTINSMVSNFWCSRTVSKVYSKLIDYYNNFYVDRS